MRRLVASAAVVAIVAYGSGTVAMAEGVAKGGRIEVDKAETITVSAGTTATGGGDGGNGQASGGGQPGGVPADQAAIDPCPPPSYICFADAVAPVALIGPVVDPRSVALQARSSLALPAPTISLNPSTRQDQLVQVPTWMWVDAATWGTRSSTASVPGVTVTATATPQRVIWEMGNGERVVCPGLGSPMTPPGPRPDSAATAPTPTATPATSPSAPRWCGR